MSKNKICKFLISFVTIVLLTNISYSDVNTFELSAEKVQYKNNNIVIATGNAHAFDNKGKHIYADKIIYYKNENLIKTNGNSKYYDGKNSLTANEFNYDISLKTLEAKKNVLLVDQDKNEFSFKEFKYYETLEYGNALNLKSSLKDGSFLKAKNAKIDNKKTILELENAEYTTCSLIYNKKGKFCPSWSLKSKKVIHDKNKKTITHKNAFLRLKNIPVLYTPYISHPDPTVKRQSGFLPPMIKTISNLGRTVKAPYFWAISKDKDLTLTPVYYFDERHMLQSSYRQAFKNGNLRIENAFSDGYKRLNKSGRTGGSRNYFFADYTGTRNNIMFKNNEIKFKIQKISQQNFVRVNKINTPLFKQDIRTLENSFKISSYENNKRLELKAGIFENLNLTNNSKYTYFLPDGLFSINTKKIQNFNTNINTYFQGKKFSDNQKQGKVRNIISLNSNQYVNDNNGLATTLKASLYNNNIYNKNVTNEKNNANIDNYLTIASDTKWPFAKINKKSFQTFTPRIFAKYTTGKMKDASANNKILNFSDVFSMNRTNNLDTPETGTSIGHGFDYSFNKTTNLKKSYKATFGLGQVIRSNESKKMPTKSSLNNKSSDFAGYLSYELYGEEINNKLGDNAYSSFFTKNNLSISYNYNLENDMSTLNRNNFKLSGTYNKFYASLNFDEKNNHVGNNRSGIFELKKLITNDYYFTYSGKKNLLTNNSEYHKIGINFENDCLVTSLTLSRDFYYDKDVTSSKTLIFGVLIKPFSDSFAPDLTDFIN